PPTKTRKKPGRKPNPASPAVRKEQNRAAQRAFRDRKERHLQQLENMIKELKDTHHHANVRSQRESQQLKGIIESLQSENYYLREVVFSFESALGKTGNAGLLQDVKAELYRRHYENHATRKLSFSIPQQHPSPSMSAESPVSVSASIPAPTSMPAPMPGPTALFAQTNLQSTGSNTGTSKMSSPQNMDSSLFGNLNDQSSFSPNQNMFTFTANSMDSAFPNQTPSFLDSDDIDSNEFSMATPNLSFDDGLKHDAIPSYRLQSELRVLASAPPATDPSIDPKVYASPHDSRIDLIPCPKLRAKMIIHQHEYDIEELCQLLLEGAICHGHPLDPHNWELPRVFFDRYGYLMGRELMKYKNKVWPKKNES
ncbi:hypothetical protein EDD21DRAFT_296354, partial [Dissophora ornata]